MKADNVLGEKTGYLLGVSFRLWTMNEVLDWIFDSVRTCRQRRIYFINADCLNRASRDVEYRRVLNEESDAVFPDGIGVKIGASLFGTRVPENVNGTDLFPLACAKAAGEGTSFFLLGGAPGVAEEAARKMTERYPGLWIAGTRNGYFDFERESTAVVEDINNSGAAVVWVGLGAPLQEKWIARYAKELRAPVLIGVGGLFDFYSGRIRRAPSWMRAVGMEWFFRFLMEPRRMFRRYWVGNFVFLWRVMFAWLRRAGKKRAS